MQAFKKSSIQPRTRIEGVRMAHLSCSFERYCSTKCDFSSPGRQRLIPLTSCTDTIKEHLRDVNVSHRCVSSEKELILARVGLFEGSEGHYSTVCTKHRTRLGVRLRPSTKCQHPLHGNRRGKVERGVNLKMAREVKAKWNTVVPVGAGNSLLHFASSCRLIIYRIVVRRVT